MTRAEILKIAKPMLFNTDMVRAILDNRKTVTRRVVKLQPGIECSHGGQHEFIRDDFIEGSDFTGFVCKKCGHGVCGPHFKFPVGTSFIRPPYRPGDILYVPERWKSSPDSQLWDDGEYRVVFPDGEVVWFYFENPKRAEKWQKYIDKPLNNWQSPYFMPREAARLFLRVTDVRVERLQEITEDDVVAEGAEPLISCPNEHGVIEPDGTLGDMCWNTDCCGNCMYIEKTYGELFGEIVWNNTIKPADRPLYGWDANPWVWVIEFEKMEAEK